CELSRELCAATICSLHYSLVIRRTPFSTLFPYTTLFRSLPFTYGIDAMRETIAGFQGADYWRALGVLAIFVALAFGLGLVLRPRMGNLILMFNRRIADTGLLVSEDVQIAKIGRAYV